VDKYIWCRCRFWFTGAGNIPIFLASNTTGADIDVTVSVTPTSANGCLGVAEDFVITVHPNPTVLFMLIRL
jgi:hypothetical protein